MGRKSLDAETRNAYIAGLHAAMDEKGVAKRKRLLDKLRASAEDNQKLREIFYEVTAPAEAKVRMRVDSASTPRNHSADALAVAEFIRGFVNAVNEEARELLGTGHKSSQLSIVGFAPDPLAIVLEVPPQPLQNGQQLESIGDEGVEAPESVDLQALDAVTDVLSIASKLEREDAELEHALVALPTVSRKALQGVARIVDRSDWTIDGEISRQNGEKKLFRFTPNGAIRLKGVLESIPESPSEEKLEGFIDGYRRSSGILYLKPTEDSKKQIPVEVHNLKMIQLVARYALNVTARYKLTVTKNEKTDALGDVRQVTRVLKSIMLVPQAVQESLFSELE